VWTPDLHHRTRVAWWALLLTLGLVAGIGVANRTWPLIVATAVGSPVTTAPTPDGTGLPGHDVPVLDSPHIPVGRAWAAQYNSDPPTSGPHFAVVPAPGVYTSALPAGLQVHALEHGRVGLQYALATPAEVISQLRAVGAKYPDDVFVAPHPGLKHGIALTAWGRLDTLATFDQAKVIRFVEALRGRYDHGWTTKATHRLHQR
jgi:hypothetical protein